MSRLPLPTHVMMLIILVSVVPELTAGEVSYWSGGVESDQRKQESTEGVIEKWDWKGGVTFKNWEGKKVTIARKDVVSVMRDDNERSQKLSDALEKGNATVLRDIANATGGNELDREEAAWELVQIAAGSGSRPGIEAAAKFVTSWGEGNFAEVARNMQAELLLDDKRPVEAIAVFEACAALGPAQAAQAWNRIGQVHTAAGKYAEALQKYKAAAAQAAKVHSTIQQMVALAWGGEAALALNDKTEAKASFDAALKVDTSQGLDVLAKGIALKGRADLGGDPTETYLTYLRAAYWLEGNDREGACVMGALKIADKNKGAGDKTWANRSKRLVEIAERRFKARYDDYKKSLDSGK